MCSPGPEAQPLNFQSVITVPYTHVTAFKRQGSESISRTRDSSGLLAPKITLALRHHLTVGEPRYLNLPPSFHFFAPRYFVALSSYCKLSE